jgi:hypothetical protein
MIEVSNRVKARPLHTGDLVVVGLARPELSRLRDIRSVVRTEALEGHVERGQIHQEVQHRHETDCGGLVQLYSHNIEE